MFCRIQSLVPTLSVELLVDPSTIQCDWVKYNLCPEFDNIRKKTELPFWVFTAISSVVQSKCFLPYIKVYYCCIINSSDSWIILCCGFSSSKLN